MSITSIDIDEIRTHLEKARTSQQKKGSREHSVGDVVQWFLDHYWVRHPISKEMIASYRSDLLALERWLAVFRSKTLVVANKDDLRAFLNTRYRVDAANNGTLPSLSCIKRFYFYLVETGLRSDDPTEKVFVRTPRLVRPDLKVVK
jgi:integrase/recombinase XerD